MADGRHSAKAAAGGTVSTEGFGLSLVGHLWTAAHVYATACPALARHLLCTMTRQAAIHDVGLAPKVTQRFCTFCGNLFIGGDTCKVRVGQRKTHRKGNKRKEAEKGGNERKEEKTGKKDGKSMDKIKDEKNSRKAGYANADRSDLKPVNSTAKGTAGTVIDKRTLKFGKYSAKVECSGPEGKKGAKVGSLEPGPTTPKNGAMAEQPSDAMPQNGTKHKPRLRNPHYFGSIPKKSKSTLVTITCTSCLRETVFEGAAPVPKERIPPSKRTAEKKAISTPATKPSTPHQSKGPTPKMATPIQRTPNAATPLAIGGQKRPHEGSDVDKKSSKKKKKLDLKSLLQEQKKDQQAGKGANRLADFLASL